MTLCDLCTMTICMLLTSNAVQDAAARLVLDTVLTTGRYGLDLHALNFKPCSLLHTMQFATEQVARYAGLDSLAVMAIGKPNRPK